MNALKKAFVTAGIVLLPAMGMAQSNDNSSQDAFNDAANTEVVVNDNVPYNDIRDKSYDFSTLFASKMSMDGIIILFNGNDVDLMKKVRAGALEASQNGFGVKRMFVGPKADDFDAENSLVIYYKGIRVSKRVDANQNGLQNAVKGTIENIHASYILASNKAESSPALVMND